MCNEECCSACRCAELDGCQPKCTRALFITSNAIIWAGGVILIALGLWVLTERSLTSVLASLQELTDEIPFLLYATYLTIFVGGFLVVIGFIGCFSAINLHKVLLAIYLGCSIFATVLLILGGALSIVQADWMVDTWTSKAFTLMVLQLKTDTDPQDTAYWIKMLQQTFSCCGVFSPRDYIGSQFGNDTLKNVPWSCCVVLPRRSDMVVSGRTTLDVHNCQQQWDPWRRSSWKIDTSLTYESGCFEVLQRSMYVIPSAFIGFALALACIEIFGILFTLCLMRFNKEQNPWDDDDD